MENRDQALFVRVTQKGYDWVTETAHDYRVSRSEVLREALAYAASNEHTFLKRLERGDF